VNILTEKDRLKRRRAASRGHFGRFLHQERPDWVRKFRFAFETFPDLPEVTRALREIDRIRKGGDPGCDAT